MVLDEKMSPSFTNTRTLYPTKRVFVLWNTINGLLSKRAVEIIPFPPVVSGRTNTRSQGWIKCLFYKTEILNKIAFFLSSSLSSLSLPWFCIQLNYIYIIYIYFIYYIYNIYTLYIIYYIYIHTHTFCASSCFPLYSPSPRKSTLLNSPVEGPLFLLNQVLFSEATANNRTNPSTHNDGL